MDQDIECEYLCDRVVTRQDVQYAQELIDQGYVTEWILDNLPSATSFVTVDRTQHYYATGFKMGEKDFDSVTGKPQYYMNNHYTIVVRWRGAAGRAGDRGGKVIVGFEVYTKSIDSGQRNDTGCPLDVGAEHKPFVLHIQGNTTDLSQQYPDASYIPEEVVDMNDGATLTIPYTYSVYFRETTDIEWEHRWDLYFNDQAETSFTHWLAIVNSVIISGILGAVCMVIWARTMSGDVKGRGDGVLEEARLRIKKRTEKKKGSGLLEKLDEPGPDNDFSSDEEIVEEVSGWKLLHGDVFRAPPYGGLLAPLIGSGMQLVFMVAGLLLLSCFGVLNPSWRGGFRQRRCGSLHLRRSFLWVLFRSRLQDFRWSELAEEHHPGKMVALHYDEANANIVQTALLFPGLLFTMLFVLNLFTWAQASSTAIPFFTLIGLACLWLLIQLPLVYVGSYYGFYRSSTWEHPTTYQHHCTTHTFSSMVQQESDHPSASGRSRAVCRSLH